MGDSRRCGLVVRLYLVSFSCAEWLRFDIVKFDCIIWNICGFFFVPYFLFPEESDVERLHLILLLAFLFSVEGISNVYF